MSTIWADLMGCQVRYYGSKYRTRVIEVGTGEPLILLHGLGGHAEAYSRNMVRLGQHFHAMAIDLLWHGFSSKPAFTNENIPTYAEQLIDFMDVQGIERAHIEGDTLGGRIAIWMALKHPDRVNRLIVNIPGGIGPIPGTAKGETQKKEELEIRRQRSLEIIRNLDREKVRQRLELYMAEPDRVTDELVEVRFKIYSDPKSQESLAQLFGFGAPDKFRIPEKELKNIKAPTLVLWADRCPVMEPSVGERIAHLIPGATFHCIKDAGNWSHWEHPEEHDRVVISFLRGQKLQ